MSRRPTRSPVTAPVFPYTTLFRSVEEEELFASARPTAEHPSVEAMQALAARHKVAIPTSFFEKDGPHYYNSLAMIGPDGDIMGTYRKSHIPDGPEIGRAHV